MRRIAVLILFAAFHITALNVAAQLDVDDIKDYKTNHLYMDVHRLPKGKFNPDEISRAHSNDLRVQDKYGVKIIKYWVDEKNASIYCLASASDSASLRKTHAEAHGLVPQQIFSITEGDAVAATGGKQLFLDIHEFGSGNVSAKDVAGAHQKDLAVQGKYGVNMLNYWVDEKAGVVMCLAEAKDSNSLKATHKEAHGLMPTNIMKVKQGN